MTTAARPMFAPLPVPGTRFAVHHSAVSAIQQCLHAAGGLGPLIDVADGGDSDEVEVHGGVALIPVRGVLSQGDSFMSRWYGGSSYAGIAHALRTAVAASDVHAIVLAVDSPGGQVDGVHELAAQIMAARRIKPVVAYVSGAAASAAYWLASAAHDVWASPTAIAGSIGVQVTITDFSAFDKKMGIEEIEIVASQSPNKNRDPKTDEGRAQIQRMVDALAEVFLADVATHRGVDRATVLAQFGQGDLFVGEHAVTAGLIDGVATLDDVLTDLIDAAPGISALPLQAAARIPGGILAAGFAPPLPRTPTPETMPRTKALGTATTAADDEENSTPPEEETTDDEEQDPAAADGDEEQKKKDDEGSAAEGDNADDEEDKAPAASTASAERKRILAILDMQTPGAESVVRACVKDPRCSPGAAAIKLLKHAQSTGNGYLQRAAEETAGHAVGRAPAIKSEAAQADETSTAKGIISLVNKLSARRVAGRN